MCYGPEPAFRGCWRVEREIQKLSATTRTDYGKGPSRRLRQDGQIPAVAYGKELAPVTLAISPKDLARVLAGPHGRNSVIEIDVAGKQQITTMVREYAHHPVSREILHADFQQVALDKTVDVVVPVKLTGKSTAAVLGGVVSQVFRTLPVRCLPRQIPVVIECDMTDVELGAAVKVSQLTLPEGVKVLYPAEQTVASCLQPEKKGADEATPAEAAKAAAAPAAAAADKKKK